MKDYSLNYDDSKKFILSYKIENGKIVAKLASGESYTVPYSEENENKIISRMEEQARYAQPKPLKMQDKILTISQPLILPIAIMNFVNNGGWFYVMLLAIIAAGAIYYPAKTIINAIKKRDIKKLNYFLDHKEELNENIEKSENIKLGVSKKAIKQIELQKSKNEQPFNINNIDNYSLSDLKALRENIKRISTFGFNEEEKKLQEEKRLIFSTSLANPTKAKIIGDMDSVPYEYYDTVLELINNFISGKNASGELKRLKSNKKLVGFMELKYDQVRIVFKHIKNNIYNVVGVFAKKANNDMTMYQTMANRMIPDVTTEEKLNKQLELGEITLKQLTDLVEVKRRKGTR